MVARNVSLRNLNTFGLDYRADYLVTVSSESEILQFLNSEFGNIRPLLIIGAGSNILFVNDFHGIILRPDIKNIYVEDENSGRVIVSAGSGIKWDDFVRWAVNRNLWGIENLSYIPGTVGATPVQNIGAYGEEVKDHIYEVRAISLEDGSVKSFSKGECHFGYRDSIFKNKLKGKYIITRVFYELERSREPNLSYGVLKDEVLNSGEITLESIREAVIRIRKSKLPEPETLGNAGSFFKNPVVDAVTAEIMKSKYPSMPVFPHNGRRMKISAGWLIEQCGWKGKRHGNAGVFEKQALVIVNYGKATGEEILRLSEMIQKSVHEKFGIILEREVEVVV
ncbi:MAG TPA: UDP-N-acetylmuramate dehydrogenase, partial [Bacteroidales bacterium]|nr:UDP-N-acetylmuramate dehydrogenase [Bacteroidales bacterium]HOK75100.1 UDP-N-acetylmuramate dehydrogenase [Bacteroidales bacterium]HPP92941.1 UDP-N-acetylmuramate dehydrogenase [Bacteroidales bacterium]HRR15813.1 UDP-N-acetylmuramate dehydrogenase [Bacteroidales bacterium]